MVAKARPTKADTKRVTVALDRFASKVITGLTLDITANLVQSTPVDTGFARANWIPKIGLSHFGVAGSRTGVTTGAQTAGIARVATYKLANGKVFITNNVDYIGKLNEGTSKQAPAFFVQSAIARGVKQARARSPRVR